MSKKNYRTLNGLFKAIQKHCNEYCSEYTLQKNDEEIIVFNPEYEDAAFSGMLIEDLIPVLKRALWMMRYNSIERRIELLVWIGNDNK